MLEEGEALSHLQTFGWNFSEQKVLLYYAITWAWLFLVFFFFCGAED
jgi:hypothetical protein